MGHVLGQGNKWKVLRFPAIAEEDEDYDIQTPFGPRRFQRRAGEALHPGRESLEILQNIRETQGKYNFAGQYQQAPAPLGGGMVKAGWFKTYTQNQLPPKFEMIFQSWDTGNKPTELSDYSVCTTWGVKQTHAYLLHVLRRRMDYPALKLAVAEQAVAHQAKEIIRIFIAFANAIIDGGIDANDLRLSFSVTPAPFRQAGQRGKIQPPKPFLQHANLGPAEHPQLLHRILADILYRTLIALRRFIAANFFSMLSQQHMGLSDRIGFARKLWFQCFLH